MLAQELTGTPGPNDDKEMESKNKRSQKLTGNPGKNMYEVQRELTEQGTIGNQEMAGNHGNLKC